jgi:hypothetical protein
MQIRSGVEQQFIAHEYATFIRAREARHTVQQQRFACSARAEQHRYARGGVQLNIQFEAI